jgi:predicted nucleotidyltransferase
MVTQNQIDTCIEVAKRYGAKKLFLFGSAASDPDNARDIDLLCEGVAGPLFFEMAGMMEHETHILVDVVPGVPRTMFVEVNERRGRMIYDVG